MWACWAGIVKGAGMPCLKMPVFLNRRNLWMGQRACVWFWWCVCLYCVNVFVWLWVVGQKLTVKVHPSPRREPYSVFQAFSEHPHLLERLLLLDVSSVRPCLDASAWHCTMSGRSLVGHEPGVLPDEKLRKRLDFREILSQLGSDSRTQPAAEDKTCVCRYRYRCIYLTANAGLQ